MRYTFTIRAQADANDPETGVIFSVRARNAWDAMRLAVQWCDDCDIAPESLTILASEA
jgi:hypothetical protein